MNFAVTEVRVVHLPLHVSRRPSRVDPLIGVAGVRARHGEAAINCGAGTRDAADETAAADHEEPSVPVVRKPDRESDLGADNPGRAAMRDMHRSGRRLVGRRVTRVRHAKIRKTQGRDSRAALRGRGGTGVGQRRRRGLLTSRRDQRHQEDGGRDSQHAAS